MPRPSRMSSSQLFRVSFQGPSTLLSSVFFKCGKRMPPLPHPPPRALFVPYPLSSVTSAACACVSETKHATQATSGQRKSCANQCSDSADRPPPPKLSTPQFPVARKVHARKVCAYMITAMMIRRLRSRTMMFRTSTLSRL